MAGGTSTLPWVVSSGISLFTVGMTGLGLWLSHRAQDKTATIQDTTERVKAEQHLVELLQEENDRIRKAWTAEVAKASADCIAEIARLKANVQTEVEELQQRLAEERKSHDLLRHRYISDITALRAVVRDEVMKAAATQVGEDVKDIMKEARPDPLLSQVWPEQGDYDE